MQCCSRHINNAINKHCSSIIHTTTHKKLSTKHPLLLSQSSEESLSGQLSKILQSFNTSDDLRHAKQVHTQFITNGAPRNGMLGPKILDAYVLCNSFLYARKFFHQMDLCHAMPWNWMIRGFNKMGLFQFSILFYFKMLGCGVFPDKHTFPPVVKACSGLGSVALGRMVHEMIFEMGFDLDMFVGSSLVKLYAENGCLEAARSLFSELKEKDCVLWNAMINGYLSSGEFDCVVKLFQDMRRSGMSPDSLTFSFVLGVCGSERLVEFGSQIHGLLVKCGLEFQAHVPNALVGMYSKSGRLFCAHKFFDMMPQTDLVTWNGMISGYVQNGFMDEALALFRKMISAGITPDNITFASFLPSMAETVGVKQGKEIHGYILRHNVNFDASLKTALIDVYFKCKDVMMAGKTFDNDATADIVLCTAMISGYVLNGMHGDAFEMFRWLLEKRVSPNALTLSSIFPAFAGIAALKLGKELHGFAVKNELDKNCHVGSSIIGMYAKCGRLDLSHRIFRKISPKDTICWNSIITSCAHNGEQGKAIELFREMRTEGVKYDPVVLSIILSCCANLPALHHGKQIHSLIIRGSLSCDIFTSCALIDMYARSGNLNIAHRVFDTMNVKNEVSWNSIIAAYGMHGQFEDCIALFSKMLENGFLPDHVTFLGIISACGHAGRVDDGVHYMGWMTNKYGIAPKMEHYGCMVDLFGRAGCLNEAFETIKSMPFPPDAGIWCTLLGACRVHGNIELAAVASRHLFNLDPQNSGCYVLLSNILADAGQWTHVRQMRNLMKEKGVQKIPGYSWIEVNNSTHTFVAADKTHPLSSMIYSFLDSLLLELRKQGYVRQSYFSPSLPASGT